MPFHLTITAHVVADPGSTSWRCATPLLRQLPRTMCPDRIVLHGALPLTSAGKIDRASLRRAGSDAPLTGGSEPA